MRFRACHGGHGDRARGFTVATLLRNTSLPPPRCLSNAPPPRAPRADVPLPRTRLLASHRRRSHSARPAKGALDEGHAFLENGALIDDYALDLETGQRAVIDLRGGHSLTEPCCNLDVYLEILQDKKTLARDDDSGGFFDAHLEWVAPARGRYIVRVSSYGSGRKRGPYTLRVTG